MDVAAHGPTCTWNNKRKGKDNIRIRLDRVLTNAEWHSAFGEFIVTVQPSLGSDHFPIVVDTEGGRFSGSRPFRFESLWFTHSERAFTAAKAWSIATVDKPGLSINKKTLNCKEVFTAWSKKSFENIQNRIKIYLKELGDLQENPTPTSQEREWEVSNILAIGLNREKLLWQQKL
ncbi:uncharacterized protein LOC122089748 [Macadamia integrifolia]|uniref:uncharacterized protein LOC122089748 n=1 Tax=Macadamia integrifolia TaxID=60698 RepID=UPI001C4E71F2|nr:uncharacterized protein LOC122089748 [Macadamia integrifolia]